MNDPVLQRAVTASTPDDVTAAFDEADEARTLELLGLFVAQEQNAVYMWTVRELSDRVRAPALRSKLALADSKLAAIHQDTQCAAERAMDAIGHDATNEDAVAYLRDLLQEPNLVLGNAIDRLESQESYDAVTLLRELQAEYDARFPG